MEVERRSALLAGIAFVDGVASGWGCWELVGWFEDHLVAAGRMARLPATVNEAALGTIRLDPRCPQPPAGGKVEDLPSLLAAARFRVVRMLRNFTAPGGDDRFLSAAIYARRVERRALGGEVQWAPALHESDRLSDIVLSLFAVEILANREFYEETLSVCDVCGRVSFDPGSAAGASSRRCSMHPPRVCSSTAVIAVDCPPGTGGLGRAV